VGSCIFNVLFILGVSALVSPLAISRQLIRFDVPVMIGASFIFYALARNGYIGRLGGLVLLALMAAYIAVTVWWALRRAGQTAARRGGRPKPSAQSIIANLALVVVGLIMLVVGAQWMVDGAVVLARVLGVSELIIGLTVVAVGTGLPEAATSVMATVRGEREIAVGNVVGSNVFNLLFVLGSAAVIAPQGLRITRDALAFDVPVMVVAAVACLPIFLTGRRMARWEGAIFLLYYVCYTVYLFLAASRHEALPLFKLVMLAVVLPCTVAALAILSRRERRRASRQPGS